MLDALSAAFSPSPSALQASGSPVEGSGVAPCFVTVKRWGDTSGSESPMNASGVGLQQWTEWNQQGDPGPPTGR